MGSECGRARPPGTMSGSDTAPFLSQADDTGDGPVPGTPGLPGYVGNPKSENPEVPDRERLQRITGLSASRSALIVAVLCYINLLNYMDRFTVAGTDFWVEVRRGEGKGVPKVGLPLRAHPVFFPGVLPDIEQFFNIGDSSSGLIQTGEWRPLLGTQQLFVLFCLGRGHMLACLGPH